VSRRVLDASVALARCFEDASSEYSEAVLDALDSLEVLVPALWAMEVANTLLLAARKKRIDAKELEGRIRYFAELPIEVDHVSPPAVFDSLRPLATEHGLTIYAATYPELALRVKAPLATLDSKLKAAASKHGAFLAAK